MHSRSEKIILLSVTLAAILGGAIFILERRKTPNIAALFAGQAQNAILENQDNVEAGNLFAYDEAGASVSNMAQDYLAKQKAPEEDSGYEEVEQQSSAVAGVKIDQIATDDGERILQSDIWRVSVDGSQVTQITDTPNQIELNPSLSPDNRDVAYEELTSRQIFILSLTP